MLLDSQNLFCENQSITTGTTYSQNVIAFGKNDVSFVPVLIQVVADFTGLTNLKVSIETSNTQDFSSSTELASSTLALADLKAGATFPIKFLPQGNLGFMRLAFVATGTETTGKITSGVVASNSLSYHEI